MPFKAQNTFIGCYTSFKYLTYYSETTKMKRDFYESL